MFVPHPSGQLLTPYTLDMEREFQQVRSELARRYGVDNRLNRVTVVDRGRLDRHRRQRAHVPRAARGARRCSGSRSDDDLRAAGIRLFHLLMPVPVDEQQVRDFAHGLAEVLVVEEKNPTLELLVKSAMYDSDERPPRRRSPRRARRGRSSPAPGCSTPTACSSRCAGASPPASATIASRPLPAPRERVADPARRQPHAVLLLRLPAQRLDARAGGHARRRRHRLPRDGRADGPRARRRRRRADGDGQRGRPVDRHGAVHRAPAPRPEHRRRHVLPLRLARRPGGGRRRRRHHLQAALQRHRRDDRRPGPAGSDDGARRRPVAAARGRQPRHRHVRRPGPLEVRRLRPAAPRAGRRAGPHPADRGAGRAGRGAGRDRAAPRPGVRRREAPRPQPRAGRPSRTSASSSTSACARAAATAATRATACPCSRSTRRTGARRGSTRRAATSTCPACRATARRSPRSPSTPKAAEGGTTGGGDVGRSRRRTARPGAARRRRPRHGPPVGHRRHRRDHRQPGPRHGGDARRLRRPRPRPDRVCRRRPVRSSATCGSVAASVPASNHANSSGVDCLLAFDLLVAASDTHRIGADADRTVVVGSVAVDADRRDGGPSDDAVPAARRAHRPARRGVPRRAQPLRRQRGAGDGAVRRRHDGQHPAARRRRAAGGDRRRPGQRRAGDRAQRRRRRPQRRRLPLGAPLGGRPGRGGRRRPASRAPVAPETLDELDRAPRRRPRRVPVGELRRALPRPRRRGAATPSSASIPTSTRLHRGRRPQRAQADGLQGRVRGRPPAARARGREPATRPSAGRAPRSRGGCTRRCCGRSGWSTR